MKIGILTAYFADYGSYFQATALYNQLVKMGHDVEIIHESFRYLRSLHLFASSLGRRILPSAVSRKIAEKVTPYNTYLILKNDLKRFAVGKPAFRTAKRYAAYECVIVGSDELWSATNKTVRFIPDYFGIGITCPHFSYAVSGHSLKEELLSPAKKHAMIEGLRSFARLSARDNTTKKLVERWLQQSGVCEHVLDPTLLNPYFVEGETVRKPEMM